MGAFNALGQASSARGIQLKTRVIGICRVRWIRVWVVADPLLIRRIGRISGISQNYHMFQAEFYFFEQR